MEEYIEAPISEQPITETLEKNYMPYAMSVIISRAIPELEDDRNCIIRDEAATIADSCVRLMTHPQERTSIANAGYQMVCRHYGWEEKLRGYILNKV